MVKKCYSCGEDFDLCYCLANCEIVCDKCCPNLPFCQDCEWFNYEDEE